MTDPSAMRNAPWGPRSSWHQAQDRNAFFLVANTILGALTGVAFWLLFARVASLPPAEVGLGFSIVAMGTLVAIIAKGGLDSALIRTVPGASRAAASRLLTFASTISVIGALTLTALIALAWRVADVSPRLGPASWLFVAAVATLLAYVWLQDAYFLAEGNAAPSLRRSVVLSAARVALPLPLVALALPQPVALTWVLALAISCTVGYGAARALPQRTGASLDRAAFLGTALRNTSSSVAEFLPGLLLVPLVLLLQGPAAAAYFGIAWTGASLLFLVAAAIARSATAEIVRAGPARSATPLRRAMIQLLAALIPGAILGILLAPHLLGLFGTAYARQGTLAFQILCASAPLVGAWLLYLGLLRARDRSRALTILPITLLATLLASVFLVADRADLAGVAAAWLCANAPFGLYAAWKIGHETQEVMPLANPRAVRRAAHPE